MKKLLSICFLIFFVPGITFSLNNSEPVGWASVNANGQNGTTGGAGGTVVTATNQTELMMHCLSNETLIIHVEGMITLTPKGRYIEVKSNKTIIGVNPGAGISEGGFRVGNDQKNIIFTNLNIQDTFVEGDWAGITQDWDGIQIKGTCHHIWIHKCTFLRQGDGAVDITNGANYVTVSYSKFGANNKVSLIGNTDSDPFTDRYKVTMHHNWFDRTTQRHPRVRFGWVHVFNNYYYDMGGYGRDMGYAISNGYGIGIGVSAQIWSEQNYFEKCVNPSQFYDNAQLPGYLIDVGSHFVLSGNILTRPEGITWNPADYYTYTPDTADQVKEIVKANAGAEEGTANFISEPDLQGKVSLFSFPNPFAESTNLAFMLPKAGHATLKLYDITGRQVREISNTYHTEGRNEIVLNRGSLEKGIYIFTLEYNEVRLHHRIVIY